MRPAEDECDLIEDFAHNVSINDDCLFEEEMRDSDFVVDEVG